MSSGLDLSLGPIINAAFFAVFFFGVITMQTDEYIRNHFIKDPLYIKSFVRCCVSEPPLPPSPCATGPFVVVGLGPLSLSCSAVSPRFIHMVFTVCICHGAYTMTVTDFGETFRLLFTPRSFNAALVIGNVIDHAVQVSYLPSSYLSLIEKSTRPTASPSSSCASTG
jgi:hypothetical protein